jgi:Family of unknown function (DUF6308)
MKETAAISTIVLRGGIEVDDPLALAVGFVEAYSNYDSGHGSGPVSFDESDLRLANRGGARISATQISEILERRPQIENALSKIEPDASLLDASSSIPWIPLTQLFEGFADIRGVGFSKMTKALHRKRPALIPMLDSVVHAYLTSEGSETASEGSFGERGTALARSYKRDLDRNAPTLRGLRRELSNRGHELTEVRVLDIVIWSALAQA